MSYFKYKMSRFLKQNAIFLSILNYYFGQINFKMYRIQYFKVILHDFFIFATLYITIKINVAIRVQNNGSRPIVRTCPGQNQCRFQYTNIVVICRRSKHSVGQWLLPTLL